MSTGFLISTALNEALRKPYHRGDKDVTLVYLIEGLPIGKFRVMLKRNFDTACWVPPIGKRDAHSIYYGDRMVERVIDFFCKNEAVIVPPVNELVDAAQKRIAKALAKAKKPLAGPADIAKLKVNRTQVLDEKVAWLQKELSEDQWNALIERIIHAVKSYGRHERQHARETPKDLPQVQKDLRALEIPFTYFNLFEDARIEHISRSELGDKFEWLALEDIAPVNHPQNMFLRCIQLEGQPDTEALDNEDDFKPGDTRSVASVADSVEGYYKRACEAPTAEHLYPILVEFLTEFQDDLPPPPDPSEKGKGKGSGKPGEGEPGGAGEGDDSDDDEESGAGERAGDLSTAADAASKGDEFFDEFEGDTEVVGGTDAAGVDAEAKAKEQIEEGKGDKEGPTGRGKGGIGILESIAPTASGGRAKESDFLARIPGGIDDTYRKRVDKLVEMLMRMFKSHNLLAYLEAEGRRISGRHLTRGEVRFVHKKTFGGKGKRKYRIVYDCSGSMGGKPDREGKLFLLAMNELARRGYLEGDLILSGYDGHPMWLAYKLPVAEEIILRIQTNHGAEGLQKSLYDNLATIKGSDDVFVYTDANITDTPLNRELFAKHRVWPVGLYVGPEEMTPKMEKHFPQNIIRSTIEAVVEAMLTRNRRTVS